ncbi:MAG TPA: HAD-IA family hydrolase [Steroidobacteraceae bacterium]|nr:HAD-IA family hydrolase [Steroidobacteraceae bacterium]HRX88789.1 HAD-IA family hydrolase [Steroidobacteraceae bacterium]
MRSEIAAICFDLDNTLWDSAVVIGRAERRLRAWLEQHYPLLPQAFSVDDMRAHRLSLIKAEPQRAHDLSYVRRESLARLATEVGYMRALADEAFEVFLTARNELELFADVASALAELGQRYTLASLTNGNADLGRVGIRAWFAVSLTAADVGAAKPHHNAFEAALRALDLPAHRVLYVGDDPHLDVHGARGAGLRTAWMNRTAMAWPTELEPADIEVADCTALVRALNVR